jgi:hypothetical protein
MTEGCTSRQSKIAPALLAKFERAQSALGHVGK